MTIFHWGSGSLRIENAPEDLKCVLQYEHKSLVPDGRGGRESVKEMVPVYRELAPGELLTYQGFLDRTVQHMAGRPYEIRDQRVPMPPAQLNLAKEFRHFQREVFYRALTAQREGPIPIPTHKTMAGQRSGLIQIPTRTGKSYLALNLMRIWPKVSTVFAAPGVDLLNQQVEFFREKLPDREIKGQFSGARGKGYSEDITVCSLDSLEKLPVDQIRLLIIDEPHAAVSPSRQQILSQVEHARIYGLGATITGRYDGADILLEGIMGPVLARKTFAEAVAAGAICPITVHMLRVTVPKFRCYNRDQAYRMLLYESTKINELVTRMVTSVIPADWQTLVFIDEKRQGALMQQAVAGGMLAIASHMTPKERKENFQGMTEGRTLRGISTDIYGTGVTFPDLRVIINAAGGGGSISSTQKPGRLAQVRPGKTCGHLLDFLFEPEYGTSPVPSVEMVIRDSWARKRAYEANGYLVKIVNTLEAILLD